MADKHVMIVIVTFSDNNGMKAQQAAKEEAVALIKITIIW